MHPLGLRENEIASPTNPARTVFISLTLAYVIAAYSEVAPIGLCTLALTILRLLIGLAFIGLSRIAATRWLRALKMLTYALCAVIVLAAGAGSARYYSEVHDNDGLLKAFRDPDFLGVCRDLEKLKDKRVVIFETQPLLAAWLCYHARHPGAFRQS
jgi:fatty-acid desaturase